jgi:hypothetical protein
MFTFQALPQQPSPLRSKKYWHEMALAITIAVIATVLLTSQIANVTQANNTSQLGSYSPGTYSQKVLSGQIVLNPKGMFVVGFNVPDEAKNATLQGKYAVGENSTNNNCCLIVWSQQEFLNYFSGKNAVPCYNQDFMSRSSDSLNITLSKGNYLIAISVGCVYTQILETELYLNFTV